MAWLVRWVVSFWLELSRGALASKLRATRNRYRRDVLAVREAAAAKAKAARDEYAADRKEASDEAERRQRAAADEIDRLKAQIGLLEIQVKGLAEVVARDRQRVAAETAAYSRQIAEATGEPPPGKAGGSRAGG